MVLICEGDAYCYTSEDGITTERTVLDELKSTQEENGHKNLFVLPIRSEPGLKVVQVRTPASDCYTTLICLPD